MKYCVKCKTLKLESEFEKGRNKCRLCRSEEYKERRFKQKQNDPVMYVCDRMARDSHSRIFAKSREYKKCYNNLIEPYGFKDAGEMKLFLYENFYNRIKWYLDRGITPSIDRIDNNIGYTKTNIQIIPFKQNTEKGLDTRRRKVEMITPENEVYIFKSVSECAKHFGITKTSHTNKVSSWIKGNGIYKPPEGYKFRYLDGED